MGNKTRRYRNFSCVTYLNEDLLLGILGEHQHQLKAVSYITHDKDVNEDGTPKITHTHVILCLHNNTTVNAIKNWFNGGYVDENSNIINTLVEPCNSIQAQFDYLIHKRNLDKYQYDISLRHGWNLEYFEDTKSQDDDTLQQAFYDLMSNVPLHILVQRYGRDFIIHYRHLKTLYCDVLAQELGANPFVSKDENHNDLNF